MPKALNNPRFIWPALALGLAAIVIVAIFGSGTSKPQPKPNAAASACGHYSNDRTVQVNGQTFNTEVPANQAEFNKGLGGRPCILPNQAMLFPFKQPGQYAFWMKDMKFPIDIIWINANHQVVANKINLQPSTYPNSFENPQNLPSQYVLEIKANRSQELKISLGTVVYF